MGQEHARRLFNFAWYCAIGANRKLARIRGVRSLKGKLPKYVGYAGMSAILRDTDEYRVLNDRVAGYVLRLLDANIRSWFSTVKMDIRAHTPGYRKRENPPPLVFEVERNAKYIGENVWRLTVLTIQNPNRYAYCRLYLGPYTNPGRVKTIKYLADGRFSISYVLRAKTTTNNGIAGIDLGIRRMATVAFQNGESIMYTGAPLMSVQRYFEKTIAKCKPSGWKKGMSTRKWSSTKKAYYERWAKQKRLILHNIAASIVAECQKRAVGTIVIGDIKGIRIDKDFGKRTNQQLHSWPFRKFVKIITCVAEECGIQVEEISERNTSKTCCVCGWINPKSAREQRGELCCRRCKTIIHADVNGAFNILNKYLPEETLGVVGGLPARPSPAVVARRAGETRSQIGPTYVGKVDLRNFVVQLHKC